MNSEQPPVHRPAARVVCLDADDRILLLHWCDPYDGARLWEPPGGGIEPGETPMQAAGRELVEETGLDSAAILDRSVSVERDTWWDGRHLVGPESFFLACFGETEPALTRAGLLVDEQATLIGHAWVPWSELGALPDRLEPPGLLAVLRELAPDGPWSSEQR